MVLFGYCCQPILCYVCYAVVAASGLEAINHRQERPRIFSLHPSAQLLNKQTSNYKEKQTVSTPANWMIGVLNSCVKTVVVYRTGQDRTGQDRTGIIYSSFPILYEVSRNCCVGPILR